MVALGFRKVNDGPLVVTTVNSAGQSPEEVDRLTWDEFGKDGDGRYAFFVWGRVGHLAPVGNFDPSYIEVGLGVPGKIQPSPNHTCRPMDVRRAEFEQGSTGMPFMFLVVIDTSNTDFGVPAITSWTADDDLAIYARTVTNGGTGNSNPFKISDLSYLVLNLDELDREGILWGYDQDVSTQALNIQGEGDLLLRQATIFPVVGGKQYLMFGHVRYRVRGQTPADAPHFKVGTNTDGTLTTLTTEMGKYRFGAGRAHASISGNAETEQFHMMFAPVVPPTSATTKGVIAGIDQHVFSGIRTQVESVRMFAVDTAGFAFFRQRTSASAVDKTSAYGSLGPSDPFVPFEIQIPLNALYTTLHQAVVKHEGGPSRGFTPYAYTDTSLRLLRSAVLHHLTRHTNDGPPGVIMVPEPISGPPGNPTESRYEFRWWGRNGVGTETWDLGDMVTVGFFLESDPATVTPPVTQADPVQVDPGFEGASPGSLSTLPIDPDQTQTHDAEAVIVRFRSDTGYPWTWPKHTTVIDHYTWTWTGLSEADRDILDAFMLSDPIFAYTPPGGALGAYGKMGNLAWEDIGARRHTASIEVALLTWTGP